MQETRTIVVKNIELGGTGAGSGAGGSVGAGARPGCIGGAVRLVLRVLLVVVALVILVPLILLGLAVISIVVVGGLLIWAVRRILGGGRGAGPRMVVTRTVVMPGTPFEPAPPAPGDAAGAEGPGRENVRVRRAD